MEDGKNTIKEFFLEIARYAGAVVVCGFCLWLVVYGVTFLTHDCSRNVQKSTLTKNGAKLPLLGQERDVRSG
jgi:hypothetical protein